MSSHFCKRGIPKFVQSHPYLLVDNYLLKVRKGQRTHSNPNTWKCLTIIILTLIMRRIIVKHWISGNLRFIVLQERLSIAHYPVAVGFILLLLIWYSKLFWLVRKVLKSSYLKWTKHSQSTTNTFHEHLIHSFNCFITAVCWSKTITHITQWFIKPSFISSSLAKSVEYVSSGNAKSGNYDLFRIFNLAYT